jgi:hypothetical protein
MKLLLFALLALSLIAATAAETPAPMPSPSPTIPLADRYKIGDAAFRARKSDAQARLALKEFRDAYGEHPDDVDSTWRLAMACYFVGMRIEKDTKLKQELFAEGRDAAEFGTKREPSCAACHFWAATNMILFGQEVGTMKMLFSLTEIQAHLKRTMELDPKYMSSGAYRVQGLIEWKLPRILGGTSKAARENLEKAVASSPDEPLNFLFLARFLEEEMHDPVQALAVAKHGMAIKGIPAERLESLESLGELKNFVQRLDIH